MENENPRSARSHPYKSSGSANSPGRVNFRAGAGITHQFFSFANNTNSLFPQPHHQKQKTEKVQRIEPVPMMNRNVNNLPMNPQQQQQPKRQPFQDLTAASSNRFIKLPASCKIDHASVTLVPGSSTKSQFQKRQHVLNSSATMEHDAVENSPSVSTSSCDTLEEHPVQNENDNHMSICEDPLATPTQSILNSAQHDIEVLGFHPDYCSDILNHWTNIQHRVRPRKYMEKQQEISYRMRSILVDWLVEVTLEFECCQETLYLAANIIDRFLSKMNVPRNKLQLIGTASLFVACKYEEPNPPGIKDFVYITDDTYNKEQILRMELIVLQALNYDLIPPTSLDFVRAFCALLKLDLRTLHLAMYLSELALVDGETFTTVLPSLIGTSAVAVSRWFHQGVFWDDSICALTPHIKGDVHRCAQSLCQTFQAAQSSQHKAVFEKYKSEGLSSVSLIVTLEKDVV